MTSSAEARLVIPSPLYRDSIRDYLISCAEINEALPWDPSVDSDDQQLNLYINDLARGYWTPSDKQPTASPVTHYWYIIDSHVIGRCSLRHSLVGNFGESHGHIGYDIHPHHRKQGYGTAMLSALLDIARKRGMESVLITCSPENTASRRMIEACGGIERDLYEGEYLRFDVHM
ncbi:MAG: hypothetical protein RL410_1055 [Actinomycetota bacterium]|jgi:predicted acetyltransferase